MYETNLKRKFQSLLIKQKQIKQKMMNKITLAAISVATASAIKLGAQAEA